MHIKELINRYPQLSECRDAIERSLAAIIRCYELGGKVLICGNGGSCADADHIVGELMKGFRKKRPLSGKIKANLINAGSVLGEELATELQTPLRAINLCAQNSLGTAFLNDAVPEFIYAQQVIGYADENDVLIGISTSGNAKNVIAAGVAAIAAGAAAIGLCGDKQCEMDGLFNVVIHVPEIETHRVQELHLPVYHTLCMAVEDHFFSE